MVARHLRPVPSRCAGWETFDRVFAALRDLQELGEDRVSAAFQDAYHAAFEVVHPR